MTPKNCAGSIAFLTPYWSGSEMMRMHLESIRRYYPNAPILVSKRGGGRDEMEALRVQFEILYWIEECSYADAYLRLLQRCGTDYACILDHDVVLLGSLDRLLAGLVERRYDVVGIEERIRVPVDMRGMTLPCSSRGWMRFAPGCMASNFLLFNWREFRIRWGLRGVIAAGRSVAKDHEFDYGIGQKLPRHRYLRPFHSRKYGLGNVLKDGDTSLLWHQWYGSYRTRLVPGASYPDESAMFAQAQEGERAFVSDYPNLDLAGLVPAWDPECDIHGEQLAFASARRFRLRKFVARGLRILGRWREYGVRGILERFSAWLSRWWHLR